MIGDCNDLDSSAITTPNIAGVLSIARFCMHSHLPRAVHFNTTRIMSRIRNPGGSSSLMGGVMGSLDSPSVAIPSIATGGHLRIGLFGGGVVGGGTYELIKKCIGNGRFDSVGASMEIVKICVRDLNKKRDFEVDPTVTTFTTNYDDILNDKSINVVIELMGGTTHAKDVVFRAIAAGKHVVTANKALIASFLPELMALLDANPSVKFTYEAAVCGGIPIIRALHSDFLSDSITKVMGIMNGTTNFMLCKMEDEGADYGDVLKQAQDLGFAEADPTADVEGHDVQAKIALLAKLSFGVSVPFEEVPTTGISKITRYLLLFLLSFFVLDDWRRRLYPSINQSIISNPTHTHTHTHTHTCIPPPTHTTPFPNQRGFRLCEDLEEHHQAVGHR